MPHRKLVPLPDGLEAGQGRSPAPGFARLGLGLSWEVSSDFPFAWSGRLLWHWLPEFGWSEWSRGKGGAMVLWSALGATAP